MFQQNERSLAETLCHTYRNTNQENTHEDIEKKQTELQKIASFVPESARKICRSILDHKGIFKNKSAKYSAWFKCRQKHWPKYSLNLITCVNNCMCFNSLEKKNYFANTLKFSMNHFCVIEK